MSTTWKVEHTDEFAQWWNTLGIATQTTVAAYVGLLEEYGPGLPFPYSSGIKGSRNSHMRELRIQHAGQPYRVFYAFDPRRTAILLLGGNKSGDKTWYERLIPTADKLYDMHLDHLKEAAGFRKKPRKTH